MISADLFQSIASRVADSLPEELLRELNGGITLQEEEKLHERSRKREPLYILGEYYNQPNGLGRYIVLYYGSFMAMYPHLSPTLLEKRIRSTLLHELRHHLESLSGERGLELEDAARLRDYERGQNS